MFSKILIANRGEIACRVIKTARRMGIKTVAVYSDADVDALHVRMADEAVGIGPAPATQSYLVIDKIVAACQQTGAQAVHPGYGFLSENKGFREALDTAGIRFIGPPAGAIAAMGDKIESKKLAQAANVSSVPGHLDALADADEAVQVASTIGYPVMLKASAGGGGKGMRIARSDAEAREGFASATNEAASSFGDTRVFAEKYIEDPRHIEIQVLADQHRTCLYLGERECSIQRRHQKVIEEAPSPFLDPDTRRAMGEQAVALAQAVGYESAGTVEFIVDRDKNFYFLEMNTRLQVEHPVTEEITGLDLVEWMIRVAAGEELPFSQDDITLTGWAIEARIYAEDPLRGFLPSTGRLIRYRPPAANDHVRIDTGVEEGGEISMFYDPMAAKLITKGTDRPAAIAAMRTALDGFHIRGIGHNIPFLAALMAHPRFVAGALSTNFIAEEYPDGFAGAVLPVETVKRLVAFAAALATRAAIRNRMISGQLPGHHPTVPKAWAVRIDRTNYAVNVQTVDNGFEVTVDGETLSVIGEWLLGATVIEAFIGGERMAIQVDYDGIGYRLTHAGAVITAHVVSPRAAELADLMPVKVPPDMSKFLLSPMPGLLVSLSVGDGDPVEAGQPLAVVEAMKMENILRAERKGVVKSVLATPGSTLMVDQQILAFE